MEKSTAEITLDYIKEHPHIKSCLKKGLINYSALSRSISKELKIEKQTSKEAILVAARRIEEKLKDESKEEMRIKELFARSDVSIRNRIIVLVVEKDINLEALDNIQKSIRKDHGIFYLIEGSASYTIITQDNCKDVLLKKFDCKLIQSKNNRVMIDFKSPQSIEETRGVLSYITSLFSENGVNIEEFMSCYTDTILIIKEGDLEKVVKIMKF